MIWQYGNSILRCMKEVDRRSSVVILLLNSSFMRPHLQYCIQCWGAQCKKDIDLLEGIQKRAVKMKRGLNELS